MVDSDGRMSYCNAAWKAFTRTAAGAPFAESLLVGLHREDRPRWRQVWDHAVASHAPYQLNRRARFNPDAAFLLQREEGMPILPRMRSLQRG